MILVDRVGCGDNIGVGDGEGDELVLFIAERTGRGLCIGDEAIGQTGDRCGLD